MTYATNDPRSQLNSASAPSAQTGQALPMQYFDFPDLAPDIEHENGGRSWIVRATNIVFVLSELVDGEAVERDDVDETMLVVLGGEGRLCIESGEESHEVEPITVAIVPAGPSRLRALGAVRVVRLATLRAEDLLARARNAGIYAHGAGNSAGAEPWPRPTGQPRVRIYDHVQDIARSSERMGRIFRNQHAMVNVLYPRLGPRDPGGLSPHTHDDFEQLSFVDSGRYVHHIRQEWGTDRRQWIEDDHQEIGAPSLAIIPPPLVHTSEAVGHGDNRMLDIFAGPRVDFSTRPGWVLNAEDYPAPPEASS